MDRRHAALHEEPGQGLDLGNALREVGALRERLLEQSSRDRSQDEVIADLRAQVVDLHVYLHTLLQVLVGKGVLTQSELAPFLGVIDQDEAVAALFADPQGVERAVSDAPAPSPGSGS